MNHYELARLKKLPYLCAKVLKQQKFDAYEKNINEKRKVMKKYGIDDSSLPATYKLPATGKLKNAEDGVLIEFYLRYEDVTSVGEAI
mgnify:CR=1 FL=1